jgi:hypothetical protein
MTEENEPQEEEKPLRVVIKTEVDAKNYIDERARQIETHLQRIEGLLEELKKV